MFEDDPFNKASPQNLVPLLFEKCLFSVSFLRSRCLISGKMMGNLILPNLTPTVFPTSSGQGVWNMYWKNTQKCKVLLMAKVLHHLRCKKTLKIMGSTTYQYQLVSQISWIKHMSYLLHLGSLRVNRSGKSIGIPAVCWLIWGGIWANYNKIPKPACFGRHFRGGEIPWYKQAIDFPGCVISRFDLT